MASKRKQRKPQHRSSKKAGLAPGTLVYVGRERAEPVRISYLDYDADHFDEKQISDIEICRPLKETPTVTWINIDGLQDVAAIEKLGKHFNVHPLVLEDILNTTHRPKIENFSRYIFIVLKMLHYDETAQTVEAEQVSLVLGENYVLSFQEHVGDVFEMVRDRIRNAKGRIRKAGPDYLAYALLDAVVDGYFQILEKTGEGIESLEEELLDRPTNDTLKQIHAMKREMLSLRRSVWPLRELISGLQRDESELITETTAVYLRDVYDHTIQVIDTVESFRDMVSGMLDIYLSSISNRMNEVMKVLTIIATIFIPLTFIAGIYGMNFEYMPELKWRYAYPLVLLVMLLVGLAMIVYFRRKKWL